MIRKKDIYALMTAVFTFSAVSCEKVMQADHGQDREEMVFQLFSAEEIATSPEEVSPETKAEISDGNITEFTLFGKENNNSIFSPSESIVINNRQGSIWKPSQKYYWKDTPRYSFHAYAHTPVPAGASLTTSDQGRTFTIKQPASYVTGTDGQSTTIDYLLSYLVNYEPSMTHQVVPVVLEHALSKISLYVTRASSMNEIQIDNVEISFKNIRNQATLTCSKQKDISKEYEKRNEWSFNIGTSLAEYTVTIPGAEIKDEENTLLPAMSFIAIPNDHQGLKDYTLSISYSVTVDNKTMDYSRTFDLYDVTPEWESGHNIIYNFLIDNGIHLTGSIADWVMVDYIEGTILPPIIDQTQEGGN